MGGADIEIVILIFFCSSGFLLRFVLSRFVFSRFFCFVRFVTFLSILFCIVRFDLFYPVVSVFNRFVKFCPVGTGSPFCPCKKIGRCCVMSSFVHFVTFSHTRTHTDTHGHTRKHTDTHGHTRTHRVTRGHTWSHAVTLSIKKTWQGYRDKTLDDTSF